MVLTRIFYFSIGFGAGVYLTQTKKVPDITIWVNEKIEWLKQKAQSKR